MTDGPGSPAIDSSASHSARVWNYLLGGKDNYAVDREAGDMIMRMFPDIARIARQQRRFLVRAVRYLTAEAGVRQFLDIGTGLPTADNTHQVAQRVAPESRIVYVDNDPLVLVHARVLLTSTPEGRTDYIEADVRDTDTILTAARNMLDFDRPVALMMLGILGQLRDEEDPWAVLARLLDALPPGSYLAVSDGTDTSEALVRAIEIYNANSASSYHLRAPEALARFFEGLELVDPGVVTIPRWRPDVADAESSPRAVDAICGVGRKP